MSKKPTSKLLAIASITLCLLLSLAARNASAGATVNVWWADNGTGTPTSGTWDNTTANWDLSTNLTGTKITFTNGTTFPEFAAGDGGTISALTITVNSAVTCAGMASGITGDGVTDITFSGTGTIGIVTNNGALTVMGTNTNYVQGIFCEGSVGNFTFNVPIVGAGGIEQHGNNYIAFYASNSYAGGTELTGDQVVYYNNNSSFGTGPLYIPDYGNAIVNGGTNAVTISNNLIFPNAGVAVNLASGNPVAGAPGTTWAGNFSLPIGTTTIETSSTATEETAITGPISGTGGVSLSVTDVGILILAGSNTYDGTTTIAGGTVVLGSPENAGMYGPMGEPATVANSFVMTGGVLEFTSTNTYDYSGRFSSSSTAYNFNLNGQTVTFASPIAGLGGAGFTNFSSVAGAMLTLSSTGSTYNGPTSFSNVTVSVSSIADGSSSIGGGTTVYLNRATLLYNGTGDTTSRAWIGASGTTNVIDVPSGITVNLSGQVYGTGTWYLNKVDSGILTLSGSANNTFLGMNVLGGTVILDTSSSPGSVYAINESSTVASGATLQLSGSGNAEISNTVTLTVSNGGVFDLNAQSDTISTLNISGSGISSGGALINSSASTTSTLTCGVTLANNVTMGGSGNITLPGVISGFGMSLTYSGTGILALGGVNTYSGGTTVSGGTLDINGSGYIPGNVTLTGSATLELDNSSALSSTATLTLPASPAAGTINLTYSGTENIASLVIGATTMPPGTYGVGFNNPNNAFTGTGLLVVPGNLYWDANGTDASSSTSTAGGGSGNWNTGTSDWWISGNSDSPWTTDALAIFAGTAGTVTVTASVNADALAFTTTGYTITNTGGSILTLDGTAPAITVATGSATIGCPVVESGANPLTINGPGAVTLSGTNSYTGGTAMYNGATLVATTIADGTNCSIGQSGAVTIWGGGGTLSYTGSSPATTSRTVTLEDGSTTSTLNVPSSAGPLTLTGQVHNVGNSAPQALTLTGGGTVSLGGTLDNSGLTMAINSGEVIISKTSASTAHGLGGGTSTVGTGTPSNSAILQLAGSGNYDLYSGCILTINSPDGELDLNGQNDSFSTLTLSGSGPTGNGALINSSATASTITNAGSAVVLAGNTTIGGVGNITLVSKVSGAYSLTYAGTGTLTLTNLNTYTGGTTVNSGGTLQLIYATATNSGAGTGTITLNGSAVLTLSMTNTGMNNVITGGANSVINIIMGSGNLWLSNSPASQLNNFSGTFNVSTTVTNGGQLVVGQGSVPEFETINAGATWKIQSGAVVDFNVSQTNPATVYLYGLPYYSAGDGALRLDASVQSGPVILMGNSEIGNGNAGVSTVSGPISGSFGFIKMGADPIVLTATNTYTGLTTISNGALTIGGAGLLGSGSYAGSISNYGTFVYNSSAAQTLAGVISGTGGFSNVGPGTLTLTGTNTYTGNTTNTATGVLIIGGNGSLGSGTYADSIVNSGSFTYNSSVAQTLSGVISGSGTLTASGPGTLTLSGTNTYTGTASVSSGGTLAIASTGSIYDAALISIAAGGILDVSAYPSSFVISNGTTLSAGGTGTNVGSTAATIKGGSSASIDVDGPVTLAFTPVTFNGDTNHPALYVSQGVLTLGTNAITVSNAAATPLGAGTYTLIEVANSFVPTVFDTNVTVTGTGLAPGTAASLSESAGIVSLVVVTTFVPQPRINSFSRSGGNLIFSGTNGPANGTYYVLTSTNVALPTTNWTSIETNTFSPTGTFSVTNAIGTNRSQFFIIEIP